MSATKLCTVACCDGELRVPLVVCRRAGYGPDANARISLPFTAVADVRAELAPHQEKFEAEQREYREAAKALAAGTLATWSPMVGNLAGFLQQLAVIQAHVAASLREQPILLAQIC
eukprot:EG_transcript_57735